MTSCVKQCVLNNKVQIEIIQLYFNILKKIQILFSTNIDLIIQIALIQKLKEHVKIDEVCCIFADLADRKRPPK